MKIIIAPQSFKGSLKAHEVAEAMREGVKACDSSIETVLLPIADGGAGTVRALVKSTGGKLISTDVHGPLGDKVTAVWGILGDKSSAVIEVAAASGLDLIPGDKLNPMSSSTYGTGELILAALESGCKKIIIGLGDSATVDGGAGIAQALGIKLLDVNNQPIPPGGVGLSRLKHIDITGRHPLVNECQILCACDVTNPLYGPDGAAFIYGPQKGATPDMVKQLDAALRNFSNTITQDLGLDIANLPSAGAAGGLGAGLVAFLGATLQRGVDLICDSIGFDKYLAGSNLVITGEGRIDYQTTFGKTAVGIARRARAAGKPVIAICGELGQEYQEVYKYGIDTVMSILPRCMNRAEAMQEAGKLVQDTTERVIRLFCISPSQSKDISE
ncbi:MAG: glycerate kinase [Dehalococcoidales bacterium]